MDIQTTRSDLLPWMVPGTRGQLIPPFTAPGCDDPDWWIYTAERQIARVVIHTLAGGQTVIVTSPGYGFRFSDGTVAVPQTKEVCDFLTCKRTFNPIAPIKGLGVNEVKMVLSDESLDVLERLCGMADIVLVPFPVLSALREQGVRGAFKNALAYMCASTKSSHSKPGTNRVT